MALYVIADLHLSCGDGTDKSMEVFGERWSGYTKRLRRNWERLVAPEDTVIIPGDISWALTLDEAREDLSLINRLPGKKILMKGNHDFWWSSMKKMDDFCRLHHFSTLSFLYHSACRAEGKILVGTRGWLWGDTTGQSDTEQRKILQRETLRLEMSLDAARKLREETPDCEIIAFFHYPPVWNGAVCPELTAPLSREGIRRCFFGHIHGITGAKKIQVDGITYRLASADALEFTPYFIPAEP